MARTPKFLVLGANSFSGATFCDALAAAGCEVLATSRSPQPHAALLPYRWRPEADAIRFQRIDLNHDLDALDGLLHRERPTHVVNFAAQSMVGASWTHPDHWMTTNVLATVRLIERLRRLDFLDRYVHVSTPEVYGTTAGWVREDHLFNPSTPYAVSRAAADMALRVQVEHHGFPAVSSRAANVYGPGQQLYRIVPRAILAGMGGPPLRLDGGGTSTRVFIHMRDVADATLRIALAGTPGAVYHVSGTRPVTIRALVEKVLARMGRDFHACVVPGPERPGQDACYLLDSTRLRSELGWTDTIALEQGLEEAIAWAERFRDVLPALPACYEHRP